jgi:hypothetical protein
MLSTKTAPSGDPTRSLIPGVANSVGLIAGFSWVPTETDSTMVFGAGLPGIGWWLHSEEPVEIPALPGPTLKQR